MMISSLSSFCHVWLLMSSCLTTAAAGFYCPTSIYHRMSTQNQMFTGIVEEMGIVESLEEREDIELWDGSIGKGCELKIKCHTVLEGAHLGICVSGVCLTATELADNVFTVGLAPETLRKSNLGQLSKGSRVNLERASEIGGRNSGHFVQGHVDGVGEIVEKWQDGDSLFFKIETSPYLMRYIVPKGFIAIDGTSLTVVDVSDSWFTFMLVEYTQKKIIIPSKQVGETVNLEVDVLAKYSESAMTRMEERLMELETKVAHLETQLQEKNR